MLAEDEASEVIDFTLGKSKRHVKVACVPLLGKSLGVPFFPWTAGAL